MNKNEKNHDTQNTVPEARFEAVEIFGHPALFSNGREQESDLPNGLLCYDLRGSDNDPGDPVTIQKHIVVNHAGTIITDEPIDLGKEGFLYLAEDDGLNFMGYEMTALEYLDSMRQIEQPVSEFPAVNNPDQESNFRIVATEMETYLVYSDSERFGKDAIVFQSPNRMECVDYIMQRQQDAQWRFYVIPDLSPDAVFSIEKFDTLEQAKQRFEQLRGDEVNNYFDGKAHLTLGIERVDKPGAMDILQVCDGRNCLVDDFTRTPAVNTSRSALDILSHIADSIGFSHVRLFLWNKSNRDAPPASIPLPMWNNLYFPVKDVQAAAERNFIQYPMDMYAIFQIRRDEEFFDYRFESLTRLEQMGLPVDRANYDLAYIAPLSDDIGYETYDCLNNLFERFNYERPYDFFGYSMSVSDVVALKRDGKITCHYVDRWGYEELRDFIKPENALKNAEMCMEDDHGIINNGKSAMMEKAEKRPSVVEKIKKKPMKETRTKAQKPKQQAR